MLIRMLMFVALLTNLCGFAVADSADSAPGTIDTVIPEVVVSPLPDVVFPEQLQLVEYTVQDQGEGAETVSLDLLQENGSAIPLAENLENSGQFSWIVNQPEGVYSIEIRVRDSFGNVGTVASNQFRIGTITVVAAPLTFQLQGSYPNPFNPGTVIKYSLDERESTSLTLYNLQGQKVATLVHGVQDAGEYEANFNGSDLASGIYIVRLVSGSRVSHQKITLLK